MIKIAVISPDPKDGNSFWRCMGPLSYLGKDPNYEIKLLNLGHPGISWVEISQCDILFLHRPCTRDHVIFMQIAYNLNKPVWVDFDDYLFQLPGWNPHASMYHSVEFQTMMAHCIAAADVVTVTTAELYNHYSKINSNVVIVPNAYRSDLFTYRQEKPLSRQNFGIWRGSNTHDGDLLSVRDGFQQLQSKTVFMGGISWLLLSGLDKAKFEVRSPTDVIMYFKYIYEQRPKAFLFPLVDCTFNRCKSNIAYMEAIHAGAICIAPDMPEWRREGVVTYTPSDSASFVKAVEQVFQISEDDHRDIVESAFVSMKNLYDIELINEIRKQIVKDLTNGHLVKKDPFDQSLGLRSLAILRGVNAATQQPAQASRDGVPREVLESVLQ